jgi:hypothetical protein
LVTDFIGEDIATTDIFDFFNDGLVLPLGKPLFYVG